MALIAIIQLKILLYNVFSLVKQSKITIAFADITSQKVRPHLTPPYSSLLFTSYFGGFLALRNHHSCDTVSG